MAKKFNSIGSFTVRNGKLRFTDPCYDSATQENNQVVAANGDWHAQVENINSGNTWGARVASLQVYHETFHDGPIEWKEFNDEVWVDSGQAGFWEADKNTHEEYYNDICELTMGKLNGGCTPWGAFSSTGYGDGSYKVTLAYNAANVVVGGIITFIDEDEQYAEDDYYEEEDEEEDIDALDREEEAIYSGDPD